MPTPLYGFDTWVATATLAAPYSGTLVSVTLPSRVAVGGLDMSVSVLDTDATPTLTLDAGDAADADRFVADSDAAQMGDLLEWRPENTEWYRYPRGGDVLFAVGTGAATAAATGAISVVLYGYPAADLSDVTRATLQALGVLAEGETARAEDASLAQEALAEVHEMLRGKGLANRQDLAWPLALIPMFALRPYAAMAGNLLADTFGVSAQRAQRLAARAAEAEREMRRQTRKASVGDPVTLEPYQELPDHILDYGVLA